MADKRVKGYGFSQLGKIAHEHFFLGGAADGWQDLTHLFSPGRGSLPVLVVTVRPGVLQCGSIRFAAKMLRDAFKVNFAVS
jgi:hypothetical protein